MPTKFSGTVLSAAVAVVLISNLLTGCGDDSHGDTAAPPMTVMSFNVLCSFCNLAEYDPWEERLAYFDDIFARHDPDLIGTQELSPLNAEVTAISELLPGYGVIYYRDTILGRTYPDAAIFYRSERFEVIESGDYWLSPTPDVPFSSGFARIQLPRLVVWARLRDLAAGGREIFFATTHFDNNSPSQELSAPLLQERTAPFAGDRPVIVVGDFNSRPNSTAYGILTTDDSNGIVFENAFDLTDWRLDTNLTPAPEYDLGDRIDHIFLAGDGVSWTVDDWVVDLTVYGANDRYPSDHWPVVATVQYAD